MANIHPFTLHQLAVAAGGDEEAFRQPSQSEINEGGWRVKGMHKRKVGPDGSTEVPIYEKIDREEKKEETSEPTPTPAAAPEPKAEVTDKPKVQEAKERAQTHLKNKDEMSVVPAGDDEAMNVKAEFDASQGMKGIGSKASYTR